MLGHLPWEKLFLELIILYILALLVSVFVGHVFLCLFFATLGLLFWHFYHILKLSSWLWKEHYFFPPKAKGSWVNIFYGIHKLRLHQRSQRKYLVALLKNFREAAESAPDAVILCQEAGQIIWCNRKANSLLGLKWPKDKNQLISNIIRSPEFNEYLKEKNFEKPIVLNIFPQKFIEFRLLFPYIENNLLIIARDTTEKYQIEKMRQDFFANVSHELRIPLTVLQGYVELLQNLENSPSEIQKKAYESMTSQLLRLDSLVSQLITLSKTEMASTLDFSQSIDISRLIRSIVEDISASSDKKQNITTNIESDLYVIGNEEQLRSAITNLIYNAIDHNDEGTDINISWAKISETSNQAVFCVKDNGRGIALEHINRLTERFYRADCSRSRKTGGTGLGLAIVKHALNNHQTTLEINSTIGKGSCFQFILNNFR